MKTETPTKLINLLFKIFHEEEIMKIYDLYLKVCVELSKIEFVGNKDQPFYDLVYYSITKKAIEHFILSDCCPIKRGSLPILMELLSDTQIKARN